MSPVPAMLRDASLKSSRATGAGKGYRDKVQRDPNGRMDLPPERVAAFFLDSTEDNAAHLAKIMQIAPDPASAQRAAPS